jgi:hypothetical protein
MKLCYDWIDASGHRHQHVIACSGEAPSLCRGCGICAAARPKTYDDGPETLPAMIAARPAEVSCRCCGRNNDVGVAKCWNCEGVP